MGSYLVMGTTGVVLAPVLVLGIIALVTAAPWMAWMTLAVGIVWGTAAIATGVVVGGRILDRSAPEVLERLRRIRMR